MKKLVVCLGLAVLSAFGAGAPVIQGLSYSAIDAGGVAFPLTVSGANFVNGSQVLWGATRLGTTFLSSQILQVEITPDLRLLSDNYLLTVANPDRSVSNQYPIVVRPVLTSVTPPYLVAGSAQSVTVHGMGFQSGVQVQLTVASGPTLLATTVNDGQSLTAQIPAGLLAGMASAVLKLVNLKADPAGGNASFDSLPLSVHGVPTITGLAMNPIDAGGGSFPLNVTGTGFSPQAVVNWGSTPLVTTYSSPSLLLATVTPDLRVLAGAFPVTVTDSFTGAASNAMNEIVSPVLFAIGPASAAAGSPAVSITATGTGFTNSTVLTMMVGAQQTTLATTYVEAKTLTATIPSTALRNTGSVIIQVIDSAGGGRSLSQTFSVAAVAAGSITSLTPPAVVAGSAALTLAVNGSNFVSGATVQWNGSALNTTFVGSTQLTAAVPASLVRAAGMAVVTVVNPAAPASAGVNFSIRALPSLASATPNPIDAAGGAFTLNVTGSGFAPGCVVNWGRSALGSTYVSATQLQAVITADLRSLAGAFALTVTDPQTGAVSNQVIETVSPVLFGIAPASAASGGGAVTITANGAGFTSATLLYMTADGQQSPLTTSYRTSAVLTAVIPASALRAPGSISLQAIDGSGGRSLAQTFTVGQGAASVTGIAPVSATAGSAGFTLTVTGSNFAAGASVLWNGSALATTFVSATQLTAAVPASLVQSPGTAAVAVANSGTAISASLTFTINPPAPGIVSIFPGGAVAGGPALTLVATSSNCDTGCTAQWNGIALATTVVSATQVTAAVPAGFITAAGTAAIRLVNAGGASNAVTFIIYPAAPTLTSVTPASITAGSGPAILTIAGTGFAPGAAAQWNGAVLATTAVGDTQLTATVPASLLAALGPAAIAIANPGGGLSNSLTVQVEAPRPVLSALSPSSVAAGSGAFTIAAAGQNFGTAAVLRWNGAALATTVISATQATATVPADLVAIPGTVSITVAGGGAESAALAFAILTGTPSIAAIHPASAPVGAPGVTLAVSGANFLANSTVLWNGVPLATTYLTGAQLKAVIPASLLGAAGVATVTVSTSGAAGLGVALFVIGPPVPATISAGIVSAAGAPRGIAPGSLISIYGVNLAATPATAEAFPLPTILNGTSVIINATPIPLVFASPGQINAQVPYEIAPGEATLTIQAGDLQSAAVPFDVQPVAPGVLPVISNAADGSVNSSAKPARPGEYVTVWVTGQGPVDPPVDTGAAAPSDPLSLPLARVQAQIGGTNADVLFAGMAPGMAGVMQVNLKVPPIPAGDQPLLLTVGGIPANPVTVSVGQPILAASGF